LRIPTGRKCSRGNRRYDERKEKFWHDKGLDGKAYGFPYDDVGGYSTYISHKNPQYMLVAIGW